MIVKLKEELTDLANNHQTALCWSGGKDSTFLLHLIKEMDLDISVISFYQFWNKHQLKFFSNMVEKYKITVFNFNPYSVQRVEDSIVSYFRFNEVTVPVVMDIIHDDNICGKDRIEKYITQDYPEYIWTKTIIGTRGDDTHPLVDKYDFHILDTESHKFVLPLWEWTETDVMNEITFRNYEIDDRIYADSDQLADTGNFVGCLKCVSEDPVYCPKLKKFIPGLLKEKTNG